MRHEDSVVEILMSARRILPLVSRCSEGSLHKTGGRESDPTTANCHPVRLTRELRAVRSRSAHLGEAQRVLVRTRASPESTAQVLQTCTVLHRNAQGEGRDGTSGRTDTDTGLRGFKARRLAVHLVTF